jgi:UrcA family protein
MNTVTTLNSRIFVAAAVAAVCFAAAPGAHADGTLADVPAIKVKYSDLNLDTQAGAAVLYKRIRYAAHQVCGDVDLRELERFAQAQACIDRAVSSSVKAVRSPMLTSEYNAHIGAGQKQINLADVR